MVRCTLSPVHLFFQGAVEEKTRREDVRWVHCNNLDATFLDNHPCCQHPEGGCVPRRGLSSNLCDRDRFFLKPCPSPVWLRILMQKFRPSKATGIQHDSKQNQKETWAPVGCHSLLGSLSSQEGSLGSAPGLTQPEPLALTFLPCGFPTPVNHLACLFLVPPWPALHGLFQTCPSLGTSGPLQPQPPPLSWASAQSPFLSDFFPKITALSPQVHSFFLI